MLALITPRTAAAWVMSTNVVSSPHPAKVSRSSRKVPWYASIGATTWSPGLSVNKTAEVAAEADAKAAAASPPSRAATHSSSALRLGLLLREYRNPRGYEPSASRSKVVDGWIAGVTAPVPGSTCAPAWTATVSIRISVAFLCNGCREHGIAEGGLKQAHAGSSRL